MRNNPRQIAANGVDLSVEHDVEFAHLAPDERAASAFAEAARGLGFAVKVYEPDDESIEDGETDWDVLCVRSMVPSHAAITEAESRLSEIAREHGCTADGWGFMSG